MGPSYALSPTRPGLFAYTCDCTVVIEDLSTRQQRHLRSHAQTLSTLALQPGGALLAAAPLAPEPTSRCADICVWEVASGRMVARLEHHPLAVQVDKTVILCITSW